MLRPAPYPSLRLTTSEPPPPAPEIMLWQKDCWIEAKPSQTTKMTDSKPLTVACFDDLTMQNATEDDNFVPIPMDGFEDEEEKQDEILWNDEVIIDTDFLILPDDLVLEPRHFRLAWNYGRQGEDSSWPKRPAESSPETMETVRKPPRPIAAFDPANVHPCYNSVPKKINNIDHHRRSNVNLSDLICPFCKRQFHFGPNLHAHMVKCDRKTEKTSFKKHNRKLKQVNRSIDDVPNQLIPDSESSNSTSESTPPGEEKGDDNVFAKLINDPDFFKLRPPTDAEKRRQIKTPPTNSTDRMKKPVKDHSNSIVPKTPVDSRPSESMIPLPKRKPLILQSTKKRPVQSDFDSGQLKMTVSRSDAIRSAEAVMLPESVPVMDPVYEPEKPTPNRRIMLFQKLPPETPNQLYQQINSSPLFPAPVAQLSCKFCSEKFILQHRLESHMEKMHRQQIKRRAEIAAAMKANGAYRNMKRRLDRARAIESAPPYPKICFDLPPI